MSFKETLFNKYLSIRNLFVVGNALLLICFLWAVAKDYSREWKGYQQSYLEQEKSRLGTAVQNAATEEERERLAREHKIVNSQGVVIRQVMLDDLKRYDRCITCHTGMDPVVNPSLTTDYKEHPYAAPENDIHRSHPIEKFGCSVCHEGQGLATTVQGGHGRVKHWEKPMLDGVYIQASCKKCHGNVHDAEAMPYTSAWRRGEELFLEKGCIGCHQVNGEGGPISVDLAQETANKPLSRIDFSYTGLPKEERTLANWIKLHFTKPPQDLVPGDPEAHYNDEPIAPSAMPFFNLSEEDANALTTYLLAMGQDHIPAHYYRPAPPRPEPRLRTATSRGRYIYEKFGCAGCHGENGEGGIPNYNYENGVEPDLTAIVGTYTREELREKIDYGVLVVGKEDINGPTPPLYMPGWKDKIKGQDLEDLITYLFSIAQEQEEW